MRSWASSLCACGDDTSSTASGRAVWPRPGVAGHVDGTRSFGRWLRKAKCGLRLQWKWMYPSYQVVLTEKFKFIGTKIALERVDDQTAGVQFFKK